MSHPIPRPSNGPNTPQSHPKTLAPLPRSTQTKLRSTLLIPTLPHLLSELLHNSLDAGAGKIEIWIDPSKEGMSLRVEDDGHGIDLPGLKGIGERWRSSKGGDWAGGAGYGFRGEALASIAAVGLLEIITRPAGSAETCAKVIRTCRVLFEGVSTRSLGRDRGTTITVKDLYLDIPIRQAALAATSTTAVTACKKVVEVLALVRPEVKWVLWEETTVGTSLAGPKKILSLHGGKNSVEIFRSLYGVAGVESVQSIRVSNGKKRIDGFISLQGSINKSHQHLYVNGYPLDRCELHAVITNRFVHSRFSAMTDDGTADSKPSRGTRRSPRRLERHPSYVLNLRIPSVELDTSYTPGKTVMGYRDEEGVKAFILAVVEEFLRRHDFVDTSTKGETIGNTIHTARPDSAQRCANTVPTPTPRSLLPSRFPNRASAPMPDLGDTFRESQSTTASHVPNGPADSPASLARISSSHMAYQTPKRPYSTPSLNSMLPLASLIPRPNTASNYNSRPTVRRLGSANIVSTRLASTPVVDSMLLPITPSNRSVSAVSGHHTARLGFSQSVRSNSGIGEKRKTEDAFTMSDSGRKRYKWIDEVLADIDGGVLPFAPRGTSLHYGPCADEEDRRIMDTSPVSALTIKPPEPYHPSSEITFSGTSFTSAKILGQIDTKFICAIIPSDPIDLGRSIVLIDQHAADERVSVEAILQELCEGFLTDSIPVTKLLEPLPAVILSRQETRQLVQPGMIEILARWGIELDLTFALQPSDAGESDYVQIPIRAVPTSLKSRLSRKEASEATRLVKLYLDVLESDLGQVQALLVQADGRQRDWGQALRWMPKEMLGLANSKACRSAIMFGDHLSIDQCERLVYQLGKTRFPFTCAHGRPSMVTLTRLDDAKENGKRTINWAVWRDAV